MATVKQVVGAKAALTVTGLSTLASATYATSAVKDNTTNQPSDLLIELSITPGTVAGNKQAVLYALASLDNSVFQTGVSTADESVMTLIGVLPLPSAGVAQTRTFSVAGAFGALPPFEKFVVKNDSGAAFTAGTINVSEVSLTVA